MAGSIIRRGPSSWRLKFEAGERDPLTGNTYKAGTPIPMTRGGSSLRLGTATR